MCEEHCWSHKQTTTNTLSLSPASQQVSLFPPPTIWIHHHHLGIHHHLKHTHRHYSPLIVFDPGVVVDSITPGGCHLACRRRTHPPVRRIRVCLGAFAESARTVPCEVVIAVDGGVVATPLVECCCPVLPSLSSWCVSFVLVPLVTFVVVLFGLFIDVVVVLLLHFDRPRWLSSSSVG